MHRTYASTLEAWSKDHEDIGDHVYVNEDVNEDHSLDVGDVFSLLTRLNEGTMDRDINLDGVIDDQDSQSVAQGILEWE